MHSTTRKSQHVAVSKTVQRVYFPPPTPLPFSPAVSLWDFLDGQPHLVAEVSAGVHNAEGAFPQDHPLTVLVVLVVVLPGRRRDTFYSRSVSDTCAHISQINATAAVK